MRKIFAIIILCSHINYTMFIPQLDEIDIFDANGKQIDDINSLTEFINIVLLGHQEHHQQDEDDDSGVYFHITKIDTEISAQQLIEDLSNINFLAENKVEHLRYDCKFTMKAFQEVQAPPPKA